VFVLEPPWPGERCPSIRLTTEEERFARAWAAASGLTHSQAHGAMPYCRFHRAGQCLKGMACKFSHEDSLQCRQELLLPHTRGREARIRDQVLFCLSDDNVRRDPYFKNLLASSTGGWIGIESLVACKRIQLIDATVQEVCFALRGVSEVELQEFPVGQEAVRCVQPLVWPWAQEPSLSQQPLKRLCDRCPRWEVVVEDLVRRSWCCLKRSTWPESLLNEEFDLLRAKVDWRELKSKRAGAVTRYTAWYVAEGCCCRYEYGDTSIQPSARPAWLADIEARVLGEGCGLQQHDWPDSINLNLYEHEAHNVGWHSDDESIFRSCEHDCLIISASWGAPRAFEVALKDRKHESGRPSVFKESVRSMVLHSGDLCSMEGLFQKHYSHQLCKGSSSQQTPPPPMPRINLTWRYLVQHKPYCPMSRES